MVNYVMDALTKEAKARLSGKSQGGSAQGGAGTKQRKKESSSKGASSGGSQQEGMAVEMTTEQFESHLASAEMPIILFF